MIDSDVYFMGLAWLVKEKSCDPTTKHGAVIVGNEEKIISVGYNTHPYNIKLPTKYFNRPDKYKCMIHAERNALSKIHDKSECLSIYVTGKSCLNCLIDIYQAGIQNIYQLNRRGTVLETEEDAELYNEIITQGYIKVTWMDISVLNSFNQVFTTEELKKIQPSV